MITADTITDEMVMGLLARAVARFERGVDDEMDREVAGLVKFALLPHQVIPHLDEEGLAAVREAKERLAAILNARQAAKP